MVRRQVVQRCPNCGAKYDVGIYVSGQKVRCRRCGIKFAVVRHDTNPGVPAMRQAAAVAGPAAAPAQVGGQAPGAAPIRLTSRSVPRKMTSRSAPDWAATRSAKQLGSGAMGTVYPSSAAVVRPDGRGQGDERRPRQPKRVHLALSSGGRCAGRVVTYERGQHYRPWPRRR